ncbi:hypothetical protein [Herbiconiux ginsengi]|uniref:ABC-type phosphate transport system, substrate-binding protein n=1 Tax=Herbiconiux ginsengi TaxID=381665 RepID=A0A1H3T5W6_9MICO|nr:hypothetical protein [Herbiconiux ginsengi]SDZ45105.1 hypothetical protein SAMN05216554_3982 [Herbiconiux ginsengi]
MLKTSRALKATVVAGLTFGLITAGASAANAEPVPSGFRTYAAVGSDTIQDVYNELSNTYFTSIASYNAFPAGTITTKSGISAFARPAGSGDGVKALSASWSTTSNTFTNADGVTSPALQSGSIHAVDIARSSSRPGTSVAPGGSTDKLVFVPLARDAVSVAIQGVGLTGVPTNFTTAELHAIFIGTSAGNVTAGSGSTDPVYNKPGGGTITLHPELPQASSGTRSFFLKAIGQGADPIGAWVEQIGSPENNASTLGTAGDISPFSVAQWNAQKAGLGDTITGAPNGSTLKITSVNSKATNLPTGLGDTSTIYGDLQSEPSSAVGTFARDVYSVVPTANYTGTLATLINSSLRDASHLVGGNPKYVVNDYGFGRIVYTASEGEYHSNWTN